MNKILHHIRELSRSKKILVLGLVDIFLALTCWIIFGPPFSILLASNFEVEILFIISQNYINFTLPCLTVFLYFYLSGFYRTSIRYSDSRDLITSSLKGSLIFGLSWGLVYLFQYEIIRNQYLLSVVLRSFLLAYVFYGSLQISRDLARILIYPNKIRDEGKPVLIYGAGAAGNELYHALKNDRTINIIGFFDNSNA